MASAAEKLASNFNFSVFSKATELKRRIWFTLGALIIYRFGTYIPLPGIDIEQLKLLVETNQSGILGMFDVCLLYTSPSPRDLSTSRMPSSA